MRPALTRGDRRRFEQRLRARLATLTREITSELQDSEGEDYSALAGDEGDIASADQISDTRLFDLRRDVGEIDAVRAALDRLANETYGFCIDCATEIDRERLEADPSAARCIDCQLRLESARVQPRRHEY